MAGSSGHDTIASVSPEHRLFVDKEKKLERKYPFLYSLQVDRSETRLLYRDGALYKQLKPGHHAWPTFWPHEWKTQSINMNVEIIGIEVEGRVKGPAVQQGAAAGAVELACKVKARLAITCHIKDIDRFLTYRDPLSVFAASVRNMVVEQIGQLPYDQFGSWATQLRDTVKDRLNGKDDSEKKIGMLVEDVYVEQFEPNSAYDRNVLAMYQLIERGRREVQDARDAMERDLVHADSFAEQGRKLNLPPAILKLQESPIGRALIEHDADLKKVIVAAGLTPGVSVQPVRDPASQLGTSSVGGYLLPAPPSMPLSSVPDTTSPGTYPNYGSTGMPGSPYPPYPSSPSPYAGPTTTPSAPPPPSSYASSPFDPAADGPAVDRARKREEMDALEAEGFRCQPGKDDYREWPLFVYRERPSGLTIEIVFHCPAGYPATRPAVEIREVRGGTPGRLRKVEPNSLYNWGVASRLVEVARELDFNTPD